MGKRENRNDVAINASVEIPPNVPCCGNCAHAIVQQLKPPDIMKVLVCKYLPPTTVVKRAHNNQIVGYTALSPVVDPRDFCAQFTARENAVKDESQAANDSSAKPG